MPALRRAVPLPAESAPAMESAPTIGVMGMAPAMGAMGMAPAMGSAPAPLGLSDPRPPDNNIWIFTDGGCTSNGKRGSRASWAYYITDGRKTKYDFGLVATEPSNNRGELEAILHALAVVRTNAKRVNLVSDSDYSIKCISTWYKSWIANSRTQDKKNLDLISQCVELVDKMDINFIHTNSHTAEPPRSSAKWFIWRGNHIVDYLCNVALGRVKLDPSLGYNN